MSAKNKLISNTGALFALQLANYILPFLIIPFLTRMLGVSLYGVVAFGLAMVQIACIITDFGFNLSATRQIASHQTNREFVRKIIGAVHLCKLFLLVPVGALFFFFLYFQDQKYGEYASFFWLLLIPIVGQTFQPIWFFQGMEKMGFITLFVVLARSSYVLLAILFVSTPDDYLWVAIANGVAQVLGAVVAIGFMVRLGYSPLLPEWGFTKAIFTESIEFFWSRAAVATYTAGGAFFLGLISTPVAVAHYSAAEQLYKGAQALFQPISQALYPYMTRTKNIPLFFKIMKCAVAISLLGLSFGLLFGDWLLMLFFGQGFSESYSVLVIFMIAFCVTTPSVLMGYPFLGAMGDTRSANLSVMFAGVLQIVLLVFIWFFGWVEASPVAVSVLLVEIFVLGYRGVKVKMLINRIKNV
ncbi:oligosaccharide flippase family protein [Zestomonas thermotolerans]|uniref:oligosaccharide flippase family protein n=1 Tax=Zestomonas thermotolerans TaxID=157784 RepID=UPI0014616ED7|nr:oligosaccharide flippase family protein [Pseudomonas thermotolerans]